MAALVDRLVLHARPVMPVRQPEPAHHQRATVRNGDPTSHAGRAQGLPPLQHLQQGLARALVEMQQADELREDLVLGAAAEVRADRVRSEEVGEMHGVAAT